MPGYLLSMGAAIMCSHGGKAQLTAPNARVKLSGQPAPMSAPPLVIAGCAFPPPPAGNGPCVSAPWIAGHTMRVKSMGMPLLCQSSQATAVPTGTPVVIANPGQMRVKGM